MTQAPRPRPGYNGYGLAVFLVTSDEGHILINTGLGL